MWLMVAKDGVSIHEVDEICEIERYDGNPSDWFRVTAINEDGEDVRLKADREEYKYLANLYGEDLDECAQVYGCIKYDSLWKDLIIQY
ncbi:hypothetical protein GF389_06180 [Candidatus Dojkabacteria bacterium]|nr:hypothetical protein [Candidatus Dojkabacteria bacterium]